MREYKRYKEYKESGIEWIGEIPKKWERNRIKYFAEPIGGYPFNSDLFTNDDNDGFPLLRIRNILDQEIKTYYSGKIIKEALINNDEILIGMDGDFNICWWNNGKALMNQRVCKMNISKNVNKKFLYYTMRFPLKQINDITYYTTVKHLSLDQVNNIYFAIPSLEEQQKIVSFLDQKTDEIDEIITKKEILIDYLEKYKKSVITEAVTKGKLGDKYLSEDGKLVDEIEMKDSGVEWIGKIPEFIDAVKIKRLTQIKRGASPRPIDNPIYFDDKGEYSWVRISDVTRSDDYLLDTEQTLSKLGASKSVKMDKGDIFLSIAATVGKPIITKIKCCIHDGFVYFPEYNENKKFLFYIFKSEQPYRGLGKHGTQINLNTTIVGDIKIPYFKKSNQEKIAIYLDQKTKQIDNLIQKTKESIEKYKEYKKSLIFEAVTGKIDLRDYELEGGEELAEHNNSSETKRECLSAVN